MMKVISLIAVSACFGLCSYWLTCVPLARSGMSVRLPRRGITSSTDGGFVFLAYTLYVFIAARSKGVKRFWRNIIPSALTAFATGSSMATIPLNLEAANKTGVPHDISEFVIPVGATMHMEGSCLAAILKISFLFGVFQMNFFGWETIATAIGIGLLVGAVVSGIPGGGMIGEILIISVYGFPPEAFPIVTMIGTIVDAPATMVNAIGDNVSSILVARILGGKIG